MENWPEIALNHINDALFITDRSHRVIWMNRNAEELFGITLAGVRSKPLAEVTGIHRSLLCWMTILNGKHAVNLSLKKPRQPSSTAAGAITLKYLCPRL